jgi:cytochrome c
MRLTIIAVLLASVACGSSSQAKPAQAPASTAEAAPPAGESGAGDAAALAKQGAELYGANCSGCHGDAGQGGDKAPPVVGSQALPLDPRPGQKRNVQFRTALDVFVWVKANMPPGKGGSLSDEEYLAIMAFDLTANGVDLTGKTLDAATAEAIVLH